MRLSRPVSLLTMLACSVPAFAAQVDSELATVQVKDFGVRPMANLTLDDGTWTIHPKALAGVGYNTNIYAEENDPHKGAYYRALAGVVTAYRLNEANKLSFDGELETDRYFDSKNSGGNLGGGRAALDYLWRQQNDDVALHAGFSRYNDPLVETGEQILNQVYNLGAFGTFNGARGRLVTGATFTRTDYLEDAAGFSKSSRDNDDIQVSARVGCIRGREAFYYVLARYERIQYDENTQFNNGSGYTVGLGDQTPVGERSTLLLEGGATYRTYDHEFAGSSTYDDKSVVAPYLNALLTWPWEEGSRLAVGAFSRLDASLTANAAWVYGASVDARYRLLANAALFGGVSLYHSKDDGHAAGFETEERTTEELEAGVEYELRRGVAARLKGDYTHSNSKTENSFNRFIAAFDIAVVF
jgi:hypothetical protein